MKFVLLTLFILAGCNPLRSSYKAPTKEQQCEASIRSFERQQLSTFISATSGADICDIDPTLEMCPCAGFKTLPLECGYTLYRLDRKVESLQKQIDETTTIIKEAKRNKNRDGVKLLSELREYEKSNLKLIKSNREYYQTYCDRHQPLPSKRSKL